MAGARVGLSSKAPGLSRPPIYPIYFHYSLGFPFSRARVWKSNPELCRHTSSARTAGPGVPPPRVVRRCPRGWRRCRFPLPAGSLLAPEARCCDALRTQNRCLLLCSEQLPARPRLRAAQHTLPQLDRLQSSRVANNDHPLLHTRDGNVRAVRIL